jgi:hypothetical protein
METLQMCRNCGCTPRIRRSLYCEECTEEMASFTRASRSRAHAPEGELCWCPDCTTSAQRQFRQREAQVAEARRLARQQAMSRPPFIDPDDPPPPRTA